MTAVIRILAGAGLLAALAPAFAVAQNGGPLGTPVNRPPIGEALPDRAGPAAFLDNQLSFERVARARESTDERLERHFGEIGLRYPAREIFIRVFKHERVLELWGRSDPDSAYALIKEYPVCALPGQLGPKRRMGDVQVPEGVYFIDEFNPRSNYHLSLRVNYPNLADRMRRQHLALGGDIFIHGGCETVGCVPIENENIEEVYWLAVQATDAGQRVIPIHIFPSRLDDERLRWLNRTFQPEPDLRLFWANLAEAYRYFEETRQVPWVTVAQDGRYAVPTMPGLASDSTAGTVADSAAPDSTGPVVARPDSLPRGLVVDSIAADSAAADTTAQAGGGANRGRGGATGRSGGGGR